MMRTTLDLDEKLLSEVVSLTGEKTRAEAVSKALAAYVRTRRIQELRGMLGTTDLIDNWYELRHMGSR
jgi:Arc/MetJ family transcription regulator